MKAKNAKATLLFLLAVAALSPLGLQYAAAAGDDDGEKDAYGAKIIAFDLDKQYDEIPDDVLLDRNDTKWTSQKDDDPDFESKRDAVKLYASYNMEDNGWNEAMKRTVLVTNNFDIMSGEAGNGFELVALVKALDRLQGVYSATEPEKRFHDWVTSKYDMPDNAKEIDARIDAIKNELGPGLVSQVVAAFDEQARHGNVPDDLAANDTAFWVITASAAMCDYDPDCDPALIRKIRDERIYERGVPDGIPITETIHPMLKYFLPIAYAAWAPAEHVTYMNVKVIRCNYDTCSMTKEDTTTGEYTISYRPPMITGSAVREIGHVTGTTVPRVYVSSCPTRADPDAYNYVGAQFSTTVMHWSEHNAREGCAFVAAYNIRVSENPAAVWTWSLTGISNAYARTR